MIKVRPGIVLTKICGEYILVAAHEARQFCPYTKILNDTGALIWECLTDNQSIPEIAEELKQSFDIPADINIEKIISDYLEILHANGYLLYEEDTEL